MGRALARESDRIRETQELAINGETWQVYGIGGSPAQAVLHGLLSVMKDIKPDLVVSGINYGENVASGVTVSGPVGAALEAASFGYPALAVSLQTAVSEHFNLSDKLISVLLPGLHASSRKNCCDLRCLLMWMC
jgi:5'-nucleotidase